MEDLAREKARATRLLCVSVTAVVGHKNLQDGRNWMADVMFSVWRECVYTESFVAYDCGVGENMVTGGAAVFSRSEEAAPGHLCWPGLENRRAAEGEQDKTLNDNKKKQKKNIRGGC